MRELTSIEVEAVSGGLTTTKTSSSILTNTGSILGSSFADFGLNSPGSYGGSGGAFGFGGFGSGLNNSGASGTNGSISFTQSDGSHISEYWAPNGDYVISASRSTVDPSTLIADISQLVDRVLSHSFFTVSAGADLGGAYTIGGNGTSYWSAGQVTGLSGAIGVTNDLDGLHTDWSTAYNLGPFFAAWTPDLSAWGVGVGLGLSTATTYGWTGTQANSALVWAGHITQDAATPYAAIWAHEIEKSLHRENNPSD